MPVFDLYILDPLADRQLGVASSRVFILGLRTKSLFKYFLNGLDLRCLIYMFFFGSRFKVAAVFNGKSCVGRCCIFPKYFRFQFMGYRDYQLGFIWVAESVRGAGVGKLMVSACIEEICKGGDVNNVWYITEFNNLASIKLALSCGFVKFGTVEKKKINNFVPLKFYDLQ